MKSYDIDWCLAFKSKVNSEFVTKLSNTLSLTSSHSVNYSGCNEAYRLHRSLDICMPIILTRCVGHKIDIFRDCNSDKFVILIHD